MFEDFVVTFCHFSKILFPITALIHKYWTWTELLAKDKHTSLLGHHQEILTEGEGSVQLTSSLR
jgi:hypothetical protein